MRHKEELYILLILQVKCVLMTLLGCKLVYLALANLSRHIHSPPFMVVHLRVNEVDLEFLLAYESPLQQLAR